MNIHKINRLLKDENNKGIKINLTNGKEVEVTKIDYKLSDDNILSIAEPNPILINLDYVVTVEPKLTKKSAMPIID